MINLIDLILSFINQIYIKFGLIDFYLLGRITSDIALVLIGVIITIFVLTATLLGRAAKFAKEKKAETEQKSKQEFDKDIVALNQQLENNPHDLEGLKKQISDLEVKKQYTEDKLNDLEKNYSVLGVKESVFVPGRLFLISLAFGNWIILISQNQIWRFASFSLACVFLAYGTKKIILSLYVVSDVSLNTDDYQSEQLQNALIQALKIIESAKEPRPVIIFKEKSPLVFKTNTEATIEFGMGLLRPGNNEAKNVDVWFFSSPEIELLKSNNSGEPFKQEHSYTIPDANTIRYKFEIVRKFTNTPRTLKIKTSIAGNFKLKYKADSDNHVEPVSADREVGIVVKD